MSPTVAVITLAVAVFLACAVEAVEATTIVLAAATARDGRSAAAGTVAALVVLTVIVLIAGPSIQLIPLQVLRLIVGALLLVFGLQWLRKAISRASGAKPLHDEEAIYRRTVAGSQGQVRRSRFGISDAYAFVLSFKGVLLEGLEVVFIVVTFGSSAHQLGVAAVAAAAAVLVVAALGFAVRGPLSRIPENTLKFIVGVLVTTFGIFWTAEGAGAVWPGSDLALLVVAVFVSALSAAAVFVLRSRIARRRRAPAVTAASSSSTAEATEKPVPRPNALVRFGLFWYDYLVGDDWQVALGVLVAMALTFALAPSWTASWLIMPLAVLGLMPYGLVRSLRR
ncbi:MAG TPA: hypothetical protein VGM38_05020 [Pseudolysinimonas sp.]|jgi:uncharacterized membrane protein